MSGIGLFFGSDTGNTAQAAELIQAVGLHCTFVL